MLALRILWTTLLNAFAEPLQTLKIFLLPLTIILAVAAMTYQVTSGEPYGATHKLAISAIIAISIFCLPWCAVNFHRWILLDERVGWIPPVHFREVLTYASIFVPFVVVMGFLALGASILSTRVVPSGITGWFILMSAYMLLANIALTVIGLVLFSQLPGLAIGERLQAVIRRGDAAGTLLLIAVILAVFSVTVSIADAIVLNAIIPDTVWFDPSLLMIIGLTIYRLIWLVLIVVAQLSLMTTLYGYFVRGRPLR